MSENKNMGSDSVKVLSLMLEVAKEYSIRYNLTLTEAFNQTLSSCYKYTKGWYEDHYDGKFYTIEQYKSFFYNFITGNRPELPKLVLHYAFYYFKGHNYKEIDTEALVVIKEYIEALLVSEQEEQLEIERLEQETKKIRHILRHQNILFALEYVLPFIKLEKAGKLGSHKVRGETMLLTEMFNYGFILGKQAERARKHNNT